MSYENVKNAFNKAADSVYQTDTTGTFLESVFDKIVLNSIQHIEEKNILIYEVGCGNGRWMKYLLNHSQKNIVKITGSDLSNKMIEKGKIILEDYINLGKAELLTHNIVSDEIKLKNKYHLIYFIDVFQHLKKKDYLLTLKKVNQILHPKGLIVIADKEKYSKYGFKMAIKRILKLVPPYYMTSHYPSLTYLRFLAKKTGLITIHTIKYKQFRGLWLKHID